MTLNSSLITMYVRFQLPNCSQFGTETTVVSTSTLNILNLAYYPSERGPYNFNPNIDVNGHLTNPTGTWGGMMRKLDTNDFQTANIEYIEFWMLDPFIYSNRLPNANQYGGDFYINLGEVSEDVLKMVRSSTRVVCL